VLIDVPRMNTSTIPGSYASRCERARARRALRRRIEIALLVVALCLVLAAIAFHKPVLILLSIIPALASHMRR
jgi:hypothetical protein